MVFPFVSEQGEKVAPLCHFLYRQHRRVPQNLLDPVPPPSSGCLPRCLSRQQQYTHQLYLTCFAISLSPPAIGRNAIRHSSVPFHILLLLGHHCERSCSRSTVDYILFGSPSPPSLHCTFASARCLILDTLFNGSNHQGCCPSHLHSPRLPLRSSQ